MRKPGTDRKKGLETDRRQRETGTDRRKGLGTDRRQGETGTDRTRVWELSGDRERRELTGWNGV
jgi:hypothetical protein